jgi:cobalt-zinc-cadmium efflux system outer membrane protein
MAAASCARVDPKPDYVRAAGLVTRQTAVPAVYGPDAEDAARQKSEELLRHELTVASAVQIALLNNPGLQASFAALGASRADVAQSALLTNPSYSLGAGLPDAGGRSKLAINLAQQVADLWRIPVRRAIAEDELERAILATAQRGTDLVGAVRAACYRLIALQHNAELLWQGRALAQRALDVAAAQLQAGEVSRLDVNLARAALVDVELELQGAERKLRLAEVDLGRLLGLSRWGTSWQFSDEWPAPMELPDDAELIAAALEQRLDARSGVLAVRSAEWAVRREHLRGFSDVSVGVDFERPEDRAVPGRKPLADTLRSSIAITLPIWDQNQAQIGKAQFGLA